MSTITLGNRSILKYVLKYDFTTPTAIILLLTCYHMTSTSSSTTTIAPLPSKQPYMDKYYKGDLEEGQNLQEALRVRALEFSLPVRQLSAQPFRGKHKMT